MTTITADDLKRVADIKATLKQAETDLTAKYGADIESKLRAAGVAFREAEVSIGMVESPSYLYVSIEADAGRISWRGFSSWAQSVLAALELDPEDDLGVECSFNPDSDYSPRMSVWYRVYTQ